MTTTALAPRNAGLVLSGPVGSLDQYIQAAGAVAAAVIVAAALLALEPPVRAVAALYGSGFQLVGLPLRDTAILVAGGAVLGWAGAWLATARHLKAIEPK